MADRLVVKVGGTPLGDQLARNVERQEVLKLYVASAVESAGGGEVYGADSPEAKDKNYCVGENAALGKTSGERRNPSGAGFLRGHGTGSAFLNASSSDWLDCGTPSIIRQPSS